MNPAMQYRPLLVAVLLMALVALAGCSTPGPNPDPVATAFGKSQKTVASSVREGIEESESIDDYVVTTRLNPCQCDGPPHEIFIRGRWTRTYFDAGEALLDEIDERLDEADAKGEVANILLRGAVDGDKRNERGIDYPVFEIEALTENDEPDTPDLSARP